MANLLFPLSASSRGALLVWCGPLACLAGLVIHRLWQVLPWARALELAAIAGLAALLAWVLVRGRRWPWAHALAVAWGAAFLLLAGPVGTLSALFVAAASIAIGTLLHPHPATAFAIGAALIAASVGWLLPLEIHHPAVYLSVLGGVLLMRARAVRECVVRGWSNEREAVRAAPHAAGWSIVVVGLASSAGWMPTVQADDLAYHLGLPWQLMAHGRYALDPSHQVWALAPWGADVLQGVVQVVAREEGRSGLNACWLIACCALTWRVAGQLGASVHLRWGAVAVFGSLPPLAMLMGGMQTELPATAITLGLASVALEQPRRRTLACIAVLYGALLGLKLVHPAAAAGLLLLALWRARRVLAEFPAWWFLVPAGMVAVGGSSYLYAWAATGNPVLPLFNSVFGSAFFPLHDFHDARWGRGFDPRVLWGLTFDTDRYLEAWDGGFGFVLVTFAGAAAAAWRIAPLRAILLCAIVAIVLPLSLVHYARYAFVGMALLIPVAARVLDDMVSSRHATILIAALCAVNLAYVPNAHWVLHTGGAKRVLAAGGRDAPLLRRYAPERLVNASIRATSPGDRVIDLTGATHAELAGLGRTATWYSPGVERQAAVADRDLSGRRWAALLADLDIRYAVLRADALPPARRAGLAQAGARLVLTVDEVECWRLPDPEPR